MFRRRKRTPGDFAEEVRAHLQLETDDLHAEGLAASAAQSAARKAFGNVTSAQERFYEKRRILWLDDLLHDLRYSLRGMRHNPGFTLAAVLTLALGTGANTAIFSLIDAVLLRSLPVRDPGALYFLDNAGVRGAGGSPPYPCFERFRSQARSFEGIAAYARADHGIRFDGRMEQVDAAHVSGSYYDLLGLLPLAGRLLTPRDEKLDPPVAVISYAYWQKRFGSSMDAIGKTFTLDEHRFTIVGITPRNFHGLTPGHDDSITLPITIAGPKVLADTGSWWFSSIGRLKPGVRPEQAQAEIDGIFQVFMNEFHSGGAPEIRRDYFRNMVLTPASRGMDELRKRLSRPLWALLAVVGLVLLIACANITNLLLARSANREREFSIRAAIGAGSGRLFRQLLLETGLLFAAGSVVGLAMAWWAARGMLSFFTNGAHPIVLNVEWNWRVAAFTAGLCLLTTLTFGGLPILRILGGTRRASARGRLELGRLLVAAQIALSVILLSGAVLFLRTLQNLYTLDAGFSAGQVGLMLIHLPDPLYHEASTRIATWEKVLVEARRMPFVQSAGLSVLTPLDGFYRGVNLEVPGFQPRSEEDKSVGVNTVSDDYFATMATSIVRGRDFTADDRAGTTPVAMLNETAAKHFFPGRDPVGSVVKFRGQWKIIGVVADAREADLRKQASRFVYVSMRQPFNQNAFMTLSVRTSKDPRQVLSDIQKRLGGVGPDIQVVRTNTLAQQRDESLLQERLISTLASAFGFLGLVLCAVGLYGVLAYSVARRTPEIGIRMALGALPDQVMWSVLRQTLILVALGLAAGIPASLFLAKLAQSLFFGVTPTDVPTQVYAASVLAVVACAASYVPARRAGRIDPMVALRYE